MGWDVHHEEGPKIEEMATTGKSAAIVPKCYMHV